MLASAFDNTPIPAPASYCSLYTPPAAIIHLGPPPRAPIQPTRYDANGRQTQYIETPAQRHERLEFIAAREWARRVAQWVHESAPTPPVPDAASVDTTSYSSLSPPRSPRLAPTDEVDVENDADELCIVYTAPQQPSCRENCREQMLLSIREEGEDRYAVVRLKRARNGAIPAGPTVRASIRGSSQ